MISLAIIALNVSKMMFSLQHLMCTIHVITGIGLSKKSTAVYCTVCSWLGVWSKRIQRIWC